MNTRQILALLGIISAVASLFVHQAALLPVAVVFMGIAVVLNAPNN